LGEEIVAEWIHVKNRKTQRFRNEQFKQNSETKPSTKSVVGQNRVKFFVKIGRPPLCPFSLCSSPLPQLVFSRFTSVPFLTISIIDPPPFLVVFASASKKKNIYILKISKNESRRNFLMSQTSKNLLRKWSRFCKNIL